MLGQATSRPNRWGASSSFRRVRMATWNRNQFGFESLAMPSRIGSGGKELLQWYQWSRRFRPDCVTCADRVPSVQNCSLLKLWGRSEKLPCQMQGQSEGKTHRSQKSRSSAGERCRALCSESSLILLPPLMRLAVLYSRLIVRRQNLIDDIPKFQERAIERCSFDLPPVSYTCHFRSLSLVILFMLSDFFLLSDRI